MTFQELNTLTYDVSDKVRHFQTFAKLFQLSVMECINLETQQTRMPPLDDISFLAMMLANQADDAVDNLLKKIPATVEGITP